MTDTNEFKRLADKFSCVIDIGTHELTVTDVCNVVDILTTLAQATESEPELWRTSIAEGTQPPYRTVKFIDEKSYDWQRNGRLVAEAIIKLNELELVIKQKTITELKHQLAYAQRKEKEHWAALCELSKHFNNPCLQPADDESFSQALVRYAIAQQEGGT